MSNSESKTLEVSAATGEFLPALAGRTSWFALSVKPRHEKAVCDSLSRKGYESFVPLYKASRRWTDRTKQIWLPTFPRYAFCHFDPESRRPILQTAGVLKIVGFGNGPEPIDEQEFRALQAATGSGLAVSPCEYFRSGQRIRLVDGPLSGLAGIFETARGSSRLVISINLLQRSVAVEVDPAWVVNI